MRCGRLCAAWALLAAIAAADGVRPRTTEDLGPIERARRDFDGDRFIEAAARLAALLDAPDTSDLAVGRIEVTPTVRGWKVLVRETAAAWSAESDRFAAAWETEAEVRVARMRGRPSREGYERLASRFRGTQAAEEARSGLAALAWERGDMRGVEALLGSARRLTPVEAAREAMARRALGFGPSDSERLAQWHDTRPGGIRWGPRPARFPALGSRLLHRGRPTTLGAFLRRLTPTPASPWLGERNAPETPFPAVPRMTGEVQTLVLYDVPFGDPPGLPPWGPVFRARAGAGSQLRLIPVGKGAWCAGHTGAAFLSPGADGRWAVRGPGRIRAPGGVASLATDGRRIFTLILADPAGQMPRMVPAAVDTDADPPATVWSGFGSAEDLFDNAWAMGPPLLAAGRLYVPAALSDRSFLAPGIVCLDAATGRRLWATVLGENMGPAAANLFQPQSPRPVLWGGRLFVGNGGKVIGALDAATGDLEWVHVAARRVYELSGGPVAPAAFEGGVLYPEMGTGWLLRADSGAVTAIPPSPFRPAWCITSATRTALLGDDAGLTVAGGPRGIVELLNRAGGRGVLYELPDPATGRAALWEDTLTVPTARGLLSVDLPSGEVRVLAEWGPEDAGDLVRLPGWVVVLRGGRATFRKVQE